MEKYLNRIVQGDCLEVMKGLPDKCVDLVLTDPPYGIGADKGGANYGHVAQRGYNDNWDTITPPIQVFEEILRVGKWVIIFGGNFFTDKLPVNGHWLVWDKVGQIDFKSPFSDCELVWTNIKRTSVMKYTCIQQGFLAEEKTRFHPTQKPVKLLTEIINDYSKDGQVILDPFLGSGTTAVACKHLGRNFIGIEKEEKYCKIAQQRLDTLTQGLF